MVAVNLVGKCALLMTLSLVSVISMSLDGVALTSKVNHLGQPTLVWTQQGKRNRGDTSVQLCGFRLVEAVRSLCRGNFAAAGYTRRSDPAISGTTVFAGMSEDIGLGAMNSDSLTASEGGNSVGGEAYLDMDNSYSDLEIMWPLNTKSLALKLLGENKSHQRFRRSIIDECCKKACNVAQMIKYCARN